MAFSLVELLEEEEFCNKEFFVGAVCAVVVATILVQGTGIYNVYSNFMALQKYRCVSLYQFVYYVIRFLAKRTYHPPEIIKHHL